MAEQGPDHGASVSGYHAHVYYDRADKSPASRLRRRIEERFEVRMGRWRDAPVGPHPVPSYQVAFDTSLFGELVPWLAFNRAGLSILVHPLTGDDVADHSVYALWLGGQLKLDLEKLA